MQSALEQAAWVDHLEIENRSVAQRCYTQPFISIKRTYHEKVVLHMRLDQREY